MNNPYSPFWAMVYSPWTILPVHTAQIVAFPLGLLVMAALVLVLRKLTDGHFQLTPAQKFWAVTLAIVLALRFLVRDLVDCGQNTAVVLLPWLGVLCWVKRRDLAGGILIGLATALKSSPALFIVYFAWKRQWKIVGVGLLATVMFMLAPMARQGATFYAEHMRTWASGVVGGVTNPDPSIGVLGEEHFKNLSLRPALARFLMHLPAGHPGRVDHPLYFDFLNLSPAAAGGVIRFLECLILIWFAWLFRARVAARGSFRVVWECACVSLLILLFSPITWRNHCVAVLPACWLISLLWVERRKLPRWIMALMIFYILAVPVLNRDMLGSSASFLLDSYHILTWAIAALLAATAGCMRFCDPGRPKADGGG